jgi:ribosomal-protein-alanine N-acetyltransferase
LLYTRGRAKGTQWFLPENQILVRDGTERDYPAIARIQQLCPEAAQWPVGDYSGYRILIALADSLPAGFCAWRQTSPDEAEVLNLAVDPHWRRRGVASSLLATLEKLATGDIFLEVAEPNVPAIALYTRLGWEQTALRRGYYLKGTVNAVVMKKRSW